MRKTVILLSLAAIVVWMSGCAPTAVVTSTGGPTIDQAQAEDYMGPKARIAVAEFQDKTAKGSGGSSGWMSMFGMNFRQIGDGMGDMLTTALFSTNRFIVLEREKLDTVLAEQDLGASGRIKRGTEAKIGEVYGADLIVTAAVTEFEGSAQGVGGATRVLGVNIAGGVKKAHIAIDIRVIDANTSQIVAATTVVGDAKSFGAGGAARIGGALPVALGGFNKTPLEQAIRVCIQAAVNHIVSKTPQNYYRH